MNKSTLSLVALALVAVACTQTEPPLDPGATIEIPAPEGIDADLRTRLSEAHATTTDELLAANRVDFEAELAYDPTAADHLDLIQGSSLALDDAELARLGTDGFVVTDDEFPSMGYGLQTVYMHDLPVYVTADAILEAVHRSYDDILLSIERFYLRPQLDDLLAAMHARVPDIADPATRQDADLYLAVARSMLSREVVGPLGGADRGEIEQLVNAANEHDGSAQVALFGVEREVDFSQFEPRGHYTELDMAQYFRAMTWLGRIDFRLLETQPDGSVLFRRRQLEGAVALRQLMGEAELAQWRQIDDVIRAFVGEPDGMAPGDVDTLFAHLDAPLSGGIASFDDQALTDAIYAEDLGRQEILSHILRRDPRAEGTLPLHRSFFFFPQRYVLDSHVLGNVVWDRVEAQRMMPDPLDVAYAALGNDQAVGLLEQELTTYDYAGNLEGVRVLADEHGDAYWEANLYNRWLSALRALSPSEDGFADGLPAVMRTDAWGRRLMNTQLASWSELRHDTILYAKQSYTTGAACAFPDAYVDPYPELWAAIAGFAAHAREATAAFETGGAGALSTYLEGLQSVAEQLRDMAERELRGEPFTAEQLAWVNQAITIEPYGCDGDETATGWYGGLHFDAPSSAEEDPVVADVHTQPTDESGALVGRVLHVGTGRPRMMIVTVDTCDGPRAYVGPVSTFHQRVTEDFERYTDDEWSEIVQRGELSSPSWANGVFVD